MVSSARIDELRKKFDENPRRYFAPLANEYRKGGDLEQAIFICQEYLPQQPGHMSGHIVYGQALFELGRHEEARTVFETALSLDPENLIALRHLGDIARAAGDATSAHAWYQRVLEADPRNEEIAVILSEMSMMPAPQPAAEASGEVPPGTPPDLPAPAVSSTAPTPLTTPAIVELAAAASPGTEDHELLDLDEFDLGGTPPGPSIDLGETPPEPHVERATDLELGLPDDGSSSPAFTESATESPSVPGLEHFDRAAPPDSAPEPDPYLDLPTGDREIEGDRTGPQSGGAGSEFATETMAELYLRQGHAEAALDIYKTLVSQRPGDESLRARMAAVEREIQGPAAASQVGASGPTIREFLASIVNRAAAREIRTAHPQAADAAAPAPAGGASARPTPSSPNDTVSGSIDALFSGTAPESNDALAASTLADAFAPDSPETAPLRGMPAHRAASELSLDHVFRRTDDARTSGDVDRKSFDEFFSEEPPPLPTNGESAAPAEPRDDVEHFNAWLNGLKQP